MSISSDKSRDDYVGNGATPTYSYTFIIFLATDLRLTVRSPVAEGSVETPLVKDVDYSVDSDGVGDPLGGNITLINAGQDWIDGGGNLEADWALTIRRVVDLKQETDVRNQGPYYPQIHEDQMDRHTMADQQQQDELDRSCKNPETVPVTTFDPTLPPNIATPDRAIVTNSLGTGLVLGLPSVDADRIFKRTTMAELKALSAADPTALRMGVATDRKGIYYYVGDPSAGPDDGWIPIGGWT